jgi:hypothetical protein
VLKFFIVLHLDFHQGRNRHRNLVRGSRSIDWDSFWLNVLVVVDGNSYIGNEGNLVWYEKFGDT